MPKHVSLDPTHEVAATIADVTAPAAAITGGEAPTEAEFNALRAVVADLVTKFNLVLANLESAGIQASA
jgi:hypothetical protein